MIRLAALWLCAIVVVAQTTAPAPQTPAPSGLIETHQVFDPASGRFVDAPQSKPADTATFRAAGTVRDRDTKLPIAGARVILQTGRNAIAAESAIGRPGVRVAVSGPDGTFSFDAVESGPHSFTAIAEGWIADDSVQFVSIRGNKTVELSLVRPATISGTLVDADTRKPVAGIEVTAVRVGWNSGALEPSGISKSVVSNGDGNFRFDRLTPGEYVLEMVARDAEETLAVARQDRNAPAKTDGEGEMNGYRRQWWPGSFDNDRTFTLRSGADFSSGDIAVARLPMYRISGEVKPADCGASGDVRVELAQHYAHGGFSQRGEELTIPCGTRYAIANLPPGQYYLEATGSKGGEAVRLRATEKVTIADRDVTQDLMLAPALAMTGRVQLPNGFPRDFKGLALGIRYVEGTIMGSGVAPIADGGTFVVNVDGARVFQLTALRLPPPYYVAEVNYAGQTAPDGMVTVNPLAMTQTLKARISAKSAGVTGTVREKDEPAPGAMVLLLPWPVRWRGSFPIFYQTSAGEDGSFAIGQLPPDTYHLLSVDPDTWGTQLQKAGVLAALAAEGKEVVAAEGQTGNATLELKRVAGTP